MTEGFSRFGNFRKTRDPPFDPLADTIRYEIKTEGRQLLMISDQQPTPGKSHRTLDLEWAQTRGLFNHDQIEAARLRSFDLRRIRRAEYDIRATLDPTSQRKCRRRELRKQIRQYLRELPA